MTFNRFAGLGTLHALRTLVFRSRTAWLRRFQGRERDVRDESASVCLGGAGRQCVWMFGRRPGAPCSDTANTSVPWKESLQDTTRLYSKSGRLCHGVIVPISARISSGALSPGARCDGPTSTCPSTSACWPTVLLADGV